MLHFLSVENKLSLYKFYIKLSSEVALAFSVPEN